MYIKSPGTMRRVVPGFFLERIIFDADAGVLGLFASYGFTFLAMWRSQLDADSMLINLKPQADVSVTFGELAEVGIGGGVGGQTPFELGVVGVDLSGATVFVEI